jgi:hypothetical protein
MTRISSRPRATPAAQTPASAVSGTAHPAGDGCAAATTHAATSSAPTSHPYRSPSASVRPGARLGSRPPGRRYSGRMRPGRPAGVRPSGSSPDTTTAVPASTTKSWWSSRTRHNSGRATSISRWSGISHCSSKGPCSTRTGSGQRPLSRANRPVPAGRPGSCATALCGPRSRVGRNSASRSPPSARTSVSQRARRQAASGAITQLRPGRSGATDHGMRSSSSGTSSVRAVTVRCY